MEDAINAKASRVEAYTEALEDLEWMEEESNYICGERKTAEPDAPP